VRGVFDYATLAAAAAGGGAAPSEFALFLSLGAAGVATARAAAPPRL
jgi:hypothetical protein